MAWKERLDKELDSITNAKGYREVTYNRLRELVKAPSEQSFRNEITRRLIEGKLKVFYRVVSPTTKATIEKYASPVEVPDSIFDISTGDYIDIDPFRNVETVYIAEAKSQ